jgi:hypothetical protein
MFRSGHRYVQSLSVTTQYQHAYIPLTEETLDEAEGVSFRRPRQSERRVGTRRNATWLWYIQNVPFADIPMKDLRSKRKYRSTFKIMSSSIANNRV